MLEKEVIFAFVEEQTVWIIHPVAIWCEMKLWSIFLVAEFASRVRNHGRYLILTIWILLPASLMPIQLNKNGAQIFHSLLSDILLAEDRPCNTVRQSNRKLVRK